MRWVFSYAFILLTFTVGAQKITYAKTINEDVNCSNYEIIGNTGNNFMIYKRVRWKHMLAIYDKQMKQLRNKRLSFIPDEAFQVDFILHEGFLNVIYQFKKNATVYCAAVKVSESGDQLSQPINLDVVETTIIGFNKYFITNSEDTIEGSVVGVNDKYFITNSEDRNKILLYKVIPFGDSLLLRTKLFGPDLKITDEQQEVLPSNNESYFYSPFFIDNDGTFFSVRSYRQDILQKAKRIDLFIKYTGRPHFTTVEIPLPEASFSQIKIAIDNLNKRYILNSLFSSKNSTNIDGLFTCAVVADTTASITSAYNLFSDTLRKTLNATQGLRGAFNTLVLRNVTLKKDGGFRITAEDCFELVYISPQTEKFRKQLPVYLHQVDQYQRSFSEFMPFPKLYTEHRSEQQLFFNNMLAIDIDNFLHVKLNTVIYKGQVGDEGFQSFGTFTTGSETHYLFTGYKTPRVIYNYALLADGSSKAYAPFKTNADGYTIMPQRLKQVGAKQVIIPANYRGIISFALVDFSQTLQSGY